MRLGLVFAVVLAGCGESRRGVGPLNGDGDAGAPSTIPLGGTAGALSTASAAGAAGVSAGGAAGVSAGGAAGAPNADDAVVAMAAWRARLATANCERDERCGPVWPSEDDCLVDADMWPAYVRFFAGIDQDEYLASTHTLADTTVLDACVASVTNSACDDARTSYEACLSVLVPKAPRQSGEPCAEDSPFILAPACAPGLECSAPYACGVCEPPAPAHNEGESCNFDYECAVGLGCVADACSAHTELPGEGESCAVNGSCRDGLTCTLTSSLCVQPGAENAPCNVEDYACLRNLTCELDASTGVATCRAHARRGDACPRVATFGAAAACNRSNWCVFASADAPTGTCAIAPLSVGPCSLFADDGGYFCPFGTYPDLSVQGLVEPPAPCTCQPDLELGAPCQADVQCQNGFCGTGPDRDGDGDGDDDDDDRRCVPLLADGAACDPSVGHCASYRGCDATSRTCIPECPNPPVL